MSLIRPAVSRGVDEWTANQRMVEEAGHALVAVRCNRYIRFFLNIEVTGLVWMFGIDLSSVIRRPLREPRSYAPLQLVVG